MHYPTPALWRCKILNVHDGDTVTVLVDRGIGETSQWNVRLKDTFAPELTQAGGADTRHFAQQWLTANVDGTDWPYLLQTFRTVRSDVEVITFDRYVGTITSATGKVLNTDVAAYVTAQGFPGGIGS